MEGNMTKIMLVEDDKSLREIYGVRLLAEGYDIKSAGDGEEALAMAVKEHPDLIISDVMMPKISGFDMLDILRATPETRDIKVIMMTALSSEDQRTRGESLGADRYLVKSQVGIEDVVRTVHEILGDTPIQQQAAASIPKPNMQTQPINVGIPKPVASVPQPVQNPANQPVQTIPAPTPVQQPTFQQQRPTPQNFARPVQQIARPQVATQPQFTQQPRPATQPLPQPTAPFSTPAPASLGNNFIKQNSQNNFANQAQSTPKVQLQPTNNSTPLQNFAPNPSVANTPKPQNYQAPTPPSFQGQPTSSTPVSSVKASSTVINPIQNNQKLNISDLMNQELNGAGNQLKSPENQPFSPNNPQF